MKDDTEEYIPLKPDDKPSEEKCHIDAFIEYCKQDKVNYPNGPPRSFMISCPCPKCNPYTL